MTDHLPQARLVERLLPAVYEAGTAIMRIYADGVVANRKADGSPVTAADQAGEDILLAALPAQPPASPSFPRKMLQATVSARRTVSFWLIRWMALRSFCDQMGRAPLPSISRLSNRAGRSWVLSMHRRWAACFTPATVKRLSKFLVTGCVRLPCAPQHLQGLPLLPAERTAIRQQMAGWRPMGSAKQRQLPQA